MTFNRSIIQAMTRTMQDLSDCVFINMANLTLVRRDSYLDYFKAEVKFDTLAALGNSSLHMTSIFPNHIISKTEELSHHDEKHSSGSSHMKSGHYHPHSHTSKQARHWPEMWSHFMEITQPMWTRQKKSSQGLQLLAATSQETEFL